MSGTKFEIDHLILLRFITPFLNDQSYFDQNKEHIQKVLTDYVLGSQHQTYTLAQVIKAAQNREAQDKDAILHWAQRLNHWDFIKTLYFVTDNITKPYAQEAEAYLYILGINEQNTPVQALTKSLYASIAIKNPKADLDTEAGRMALLHAWIMQCAAMMYKQNLKYDSEKVGHLREYKYMQEGNIGDFMLIYIVSAALISMVGLILTMVPLLAIVYESELGALYSVVFPHIAIGFGEIYGLTLAFFAAAEIVIWAVPLIVALCAKLSFTTTLKGETAQVLDQRCDQLAAKFPSESAPTLVPFAIQYAGRKRVVEDDASTSTVRGPVSVAM
jgi:hypothetical protein